MIYKIYYEGKRKFALHIKNREELMALRNAAENVAHLSEAKRGNQEEKKKLLQLAYNIGHVNGPLAGCKSIGSYFFHDVDCYDEAHSERIKRLVMEKKDEIGLRMLERSASGGWHLVCERLRGTTILENQVRVATILKVEMDTSAKDLQRVVFSTSGSEDDLPFMDDCLFTEPMTAEECEAEYELLQERQRRGEEDVPAGAKKANKHYRPWEEESVTVLQCYSSKKNTSDSYNGIPFKEIIAKYWEMYNDGKTPADGDRNVLTFELAVTLRSICDYSLERMLSVIPNYWMRADGTCSAEDEAEWRRTLESALKEPRKGMPFRVKQVLKALKMTAGVKACGGTMTTPPPMPKKLPPLLRLLTKNVPWFYKPAVANAVFPALGAHLHGVRFRYWDNVDHEATFMNVLIGRQSIGKGTIKKPIEYIMEDIKQRDQPNRKREAEWKQRNPSGKAKKDPRPADICVQMLIDNLTDAIFNQRVIDAHINGEKYLFTIVDEIEALKKVTSRGTVAEVGLLIRKAYDNSDVGQERFGSESVSGIAPLRWNFNASTTPPNARKFFAQMVNDGTMSRLDIATIIKDDDDDSAPILGIYDNTFAEELKPYIERLDRASGLIECTQATKLSLKMKQENSDTANLYESEAYRVLSYRANVIAWLKGMVLYVAHGYKWSKEIADFVNWTEKYNLWCKMLYFGEQLERELREEVEIQRQSGPRNLLDLLPEEFSKDQYLQMRQSQGKSGNGDGTLRVWQTRGYIIHDDVSNLYCKTSEYKKKFNN